MKYFFIFSFFSFFVLNSKKVQNSELEEKIKSRCFGKVSKNFSEITVNNDKNFKKFLKNYEKNSVLKKLGDDFIGYFNNSSIYIFNFVNKKSYSIKFELVKDEKVQSFSCDKKYIYVKFRKSFCVYDFSGKKIATYNFNHSREISGMDIHISDYFNGTEKGKLLYLVTHNRDIIGFYFSPSNKKIDLTFFQNDFYSSNNAYKFNFFVDKNNIYIFMNKRFSILDKLSGKILKNVYVKVFFDNMIVSKNSVFLYSKMRFCQIDLNNNFDLSYNEEVVFYNKTLKINANSILYNDISYDSKYIFTMFFENIFFGYSENTYDSICFLIKNKKISEFILKNFAISHVFNTSKGLMLVDVKSGKLLFV